MFKAQPSGTQIADAPESVVLLYMSSNTPTMALGSGPAQPTRAFIVATAPATDAYRIYVFFGAEGGTPEAGLLFRSETEPVPSRHYAATLSRATEMVASRGFEMTEAPIAALSGEERAAWLAPLPLTESAKPTGPLLSPGVPVGEGLGAGPGPVVGAPPTSETRATLRVEQSFLTDEVVHSLGRLLSLF